MTASCQICRDTGIAHKAPYIAPDIWTMTACTCPAGREMVAAMQKRTDQNPIKKEE